MQNRSKLIEEGRKSIEAIKNVPFNEIKTPAGQGTIHDDMLLEGSPFY